MGGRGGSKFCLLHLGGSSWSVEPVASPDVPPPTQVKSGLQVNQKGLRRLGEFFTIQSLITSLFDLPGGLLNNTGAG